MSGLRTRLAEAARGVPALLRRRALWLGLLAGLGSAAAGYLLQRFGAGTLAAWLVALAALVTAVAALIVMVIWWRRRARLGRTQTAVSLEASPADGLREGLEACLERLEADGPGRWARRLGARARYRVPWLLVLGLDDPGRLVRCSHLHLPYDDGTRCPFREVPEADSAFWLTDRGLFITAGARHATGSPEASPWRPMLRLLRSCRPRSPVDAVIVTLPLAELGAGAQGEVDATAQWVRSRLEELEQELGVRPPVVLAGCGIDQLPGFEAFASAGERDELKGGWGAALDPEGKPSAAAGALQAIADRERLPRTESLRAPEQRRRAFGFPASLRPRTEALAGLLQALLRRDPYRPLPRLEGIYLVGGESGAYIPGLLEDAVLPRIGTATPTPQRRRRRLLARAVSAAVGAAVVAVAAYHGGAALERQREVASELERHAADLQAKVQAEALSDPDRQQALVDLQDSRSRLAGPGVPAPVSRVLPGLERAEALRARAGELIADLAAERMLPSAVEALDRRLRDYTRRFPYWEPQRQAAEREAYRRLLAARLALVEAEPGAPREPVAAALARAWTRVAEVEAQEIRSAVARGLEQALARPERARAVAERLDTASGGRVVERAREQLRIAPRPDALLEALEGAAERALDPVSLREMLSADERRVWTFGAKVPPAYRGGAWEEHLEPRLERLLERLAAPDPVLGRSPEEVISADERADLRERTEASYEAAFVDAWLDFLAMLRPASFSDLDQAARRLEALAQEDGAIEAVLGGVHAHLAAHAAGWEDEVLEDAPGDLGGEYRHDSRGEALLRLIRPEADDDDEGVGELTETLRSSLAALHEAVADMASAADPAARSAECAAEVLGGEREGRALVTSRREIEAVLDGVDPGLRRFLEPLAYGAIEQTWERLLAVTQEELDARWRAEVVAPYRETLADRFPLTPGGSSAGLEDFEAFFRPEDGILAEFRERHLEPFLDWGGDQWQPRRWLARGVSIAPAAADAIREAELIRDSLFADDGQLRLVYRLAPRPNPDLSEMRWEAGESALRYRNGPPARERFVWPQRDGGIRVATRSVHTGESASLRESGPWALLRLIHAADQVELASSNELRLGWDLHADASEPHEPFRVRLRTERSAPVLAWRDLGSFRLPSRLVGSAISVEGGEGSQGGQEP